MSLHQTLKDATSLLERQERSFALVGGLAVSVRAEVRFTRDVDLVVSVCNDSEAEQCVYLLQQQGFGVRATVEQEATARLATARLQHPSGVVCDLLFATTGIETEIIALSTPIEVFPDQHVPTAVPEALLAMKVLSVTGERPHDQTDILAIARMNPDFDDGRVRELLELIEQRGYARDQNLVEKWVKIRSLF